MPQALQYLAASTPDMNVRPSYQPRRPLQKFPAPNWKKSPPMPNPIRLNGPGVAHARNPHPFHRRFPVLPALNYVGIYKTDPPIPQYEQIAVNLLDGNESNLLPTDTPPGSIGTAVATGGGKSRLELWWWLVACAALPLLMIEWWVYTRRVHL